MYWADNGNNDIINSALLSKNSLEKKSGIPENVEMSFESPIVKTLTSIILFSSFLETNISYPHMSIS